MSNAISRFRDDLKGAFDATGTNTSRVPAEAVNPPHIVIGEIALVPAEIGDRWEATATVYVYASAADVRNVEEVEQYMAPDGDLSISAAVNTINAYVEEIEEAQVYQFAGVEYFGSRITVKAVIS